MSKEHIEEQLNSAQKSIDDLVRQQNDLYEKNKYKFRFSKFKNFQTSKVEWQLLELTKSKLSNCRESPIDERGFCIECKEKNNGKIKIW